MKELTPLLEKLAAQFGTTSEYLWGVLIQQAPISASITLLIIFIFALAAFVLYKVHLKFMRKRPDNEDSYYDEYEELLGVPMIILMLVIGTGVVVSVCSIGNVITGFVNPEYWALETVLDAVK